jgi:hypothetical protein
MILLLATWGCFMPRSPAITSARSGGNAVPQISISRGQLRNDVMILKRLTYHTNSRMQS